MTPADPVGSALHREQTWRLYLLGRLDPAAAFAFERHLAGCPGCRDEAAEFGDLATAIALLPEDEVTGPL